MGKRFSKIILSSLLLLSGVAQGLTLTQILQSPERPTMAEIARDKAALEDRTLVPLKVSHVDTAGWFEIMKRGAPRNIAAMELAFPNAKFAFLGRDSQTMADIFEAFYMSLGITDRVVRIGVSKASFEKVDNATLVKMLEGSGFSFAHLSPDRPFILVDTISKGFGRQGRLLLNAVYSEYAKNNGDPGKLLRSVNMIGLKVRTVGTGNEISFQSVETELGKEEARYLALRGQKVDFGDIHKIITIPDNPEKFNESGYEHFVGSWNGSYGAIQNIDGKFRAAMGAAQPESVRKNILWLQKNILNYFSTPAFLEEVKVQARSLGYEFSISKSCKTSLKRKAG
jgi:hypothetical protein